MQKTFYLLYTKDFINSASDNPYNDIQEALVLNSKKLLNKYLSLLKQDIITNYSDNLKNIHYDNKHVSDEDKHITVQLIGNDIKNNSVISLINCQYTKFVIHRKNEKDLPKLFYEGHEQLFNLHNNVNPITDNTIIKFHSMKPVNDWELIDEQGQLLLPKEKDKWNVNKFKKYNHNNNYIEYFAEDNSNLKSHHVNYVINNNQVINTVIRKIPIIKTIEVENEGEVS